MLAWPICWPRAKEPMMTRLRTVWLRRLLLVHCVMFVNGCKSTAAHQRCEDEADYASYDCRTVRNLG